MKITAKKNLVIFHNERDWYDRVVPAIQRDYGATITAISWRLRRELGFSVRHHQHWVTFDHTGDRPRRFLEEQVHLDFYNEAAQSWFLLRYTNLDQ